MITKFQQGAASKHDALPCVMEERLWLREMREAAALTALNRLMIPAVASAQHRTADSAAGINSNIM